MEKPKPDTVPLAVGAHAVGIDYNAAYKLLLRGELKGERQGKHWVVRVDSIERLKRRAGLLSPRA